MSAKCCFMTDDPCALCGTVLKVQCSKDPEWVIYTDDPRPDASFVESCSEHIGALLTDAPTHHIYPFTAQEKTP